MKLSLTFECEVRSVDVLVAQVAGEGAALVARGVSSDHRPGVGATVVV